MEELQHSNAELEQFAYVASHDLQEPLRMMSNYIELLAEDYRGKLDDDADRYIKYVVEGADRMFVLIDDLLAYSRVRSRAKPFQLTDCDGVITQAIANLQMAIKSTSAEITFDKLPTIWVDDSQIAQLLQNLVSNAIKFHNSKPPKVHISAWQDNDEWVFSVKDNGIGIEPEYAERIFAIFQRLHTHDEYPGTGIGLAVCRNIVERHGGRIWVESEFGKGSTFLFTINTKGDTES